MVERTIDDEDFIERVRQSLGNIEEDRITDDVILNAEDTFVQPYLKEHLDEDHDEDQDNLNNAYIAFTAEMAFKSIPALSTVSGGGLTANISVSQMRRDLIMKTDMALAQIGLDPLARAEERPSALAARTDGMLRE